MISIIIAMDDNGGIGKDGDVPWRLSSDLELFRQKTTSHIVVMGRKTWDSIPTKFRPLKNRVNVVLTSRTDTTYPKEVVVVHSLEEMKNWITQQTGDVFIIGGKVPIEYMMLNNLVDRICLTHVAGNYECDIKLYFTPFSLAEGWKLDQASRKILSHPTIHAEYCEFIRSEPV